MTSLYSRVPLAARRASRVRRGDSAPRAGAAMQDRAGHRPPLLPFGNETATEAVPALTAGRTGQSVFTT